MKIIWSHNWQAYVIYDDLGFPLKAFDTRVEAELFLKEREEIEL